MRAGWFRGASVVVPVALAVVVVAVQPWHGATLVALSPRHGVDEGDLLALALLVPAAAAFARTAVGRAVAARIRSAPLLLGAPAAAGALGFALLLIGVLDIGDVLEEPGRAAEALGIFVFALAFGWVVVALAAGSPPLPAPRGRVQLICAMSLVAGFVVDSWMRPSGTVFGPALLAAAVALTASTPGARRVAVGLVVALTLLNVASLTDFRGIDVQMAEHGGAPARSAAVGVVLVAFCAVQLGTNRGRAAVRAGHSA
jgi:hypothetical protein